MANANMEKRWRVTWETTTNGRTQTEMRLGARYREPPRTVQYKLYKRLASVQHGIRLSVPFIL